MAEGGRTDGANLRNRLLSTVTTQCSKSSRRVKRDSVSVKTLVSAPKRASNARRYRPAGIRSENRAAPTHRCAGICTGERDAIEPIRHRIDVRYPVGPAVRGAENGARITDYGPRIWICEEDSVERIGRAA